jgi:DNA-binding SARP family transcriptional activator
MHPTAMHPTAMRLRLLGAPALGLEGEAPAPLDRKDAALLALAALDAGRSRAAAAALLWPAATPAQAAGSLRQRLFRLRRRVGAGLVEPAGPIALGPAVWCDASAPAAFGEARLLAGCTFDDCAELDAWLGAQREARALAAHRAGEAEADRLEGAGEFDAALALAEALLAADEHSEAALGRVMRLHHLRGDRAAGVLAFERFERRLREELGLAPGAAARALLATIERGAAPGRGAAGLVPTPSRVPASLLRPPRLVGRGPEREQVALAFAAQRVFVLQGEAGMGKSRLLAELAAELGGGAIVVSARPGDAAVPYALLARLLRALRARVAAVPAPGVRLELARVLPEVEAPAATHPPPLRFGLLAAVQWMLAQAARAGGRELLLDDLHFADAASLELLQPVLAGEAAGIEGIDGIEGRPDEAPADAGRGAAPAGGGWRFGLALRPGEAGAARACCEALAEAQRLHRIVLAPLAPRDMAEFVDTLGLPGLQGAALAEALVRHTGGNPLFALETLKDLVLRGPAGSGAALPQPASVGALIERRLRALSPAALALARVAAIAGGEFDIPLAEAVLRTPALALADAWSELQAAQVLAGPAFAHDLVHDAVARSVPESIARHVHAEVAAFVAARGAPAASVARHWQAAGRAAEAASAWEAAAKEAAARGRPAEAREAGEAASQSWSDAGECGRAFDALADVGDSACSSLPAPALRAFMRRLVARAVTPRQQSIGWRFTADACNQLRDGEPALAAAERAIALATAAGDDGLRRQAARAQSMALVALGRPAEAVAPLTDALAGAPADAGLRSDLGLALSRAGRCREALVQNERAAEDALAAGQWVHAQTALTNATVVLVALGRVERALANHERAMRLPVEGGQTPLNDAIDEFTRAGLLIELGRFGEALRALLALDEVIDGADDGQWRLMQAEHLCTLHGLLGQPARAVQALARTEAAVGDRFPVARAGLRLRVARCTRPPAAEGAALAAAFEALVAGRSMAARQRLSTAIEVAHFAAPEEAARRLDQVMADADALEHFGLGQTAAAARVRALLALGADEDAAALASQVLARLPEVHPYDTYLPQLWHDAAEAFTRTVRTAEAIAAVAAATRWIDAAAAGLPDSERAGFLDRNPVNVALRAMWARLARALR